MRHWLKHNGERPGNLRDPEAWETTPKQSAFKAYEPGYLHMDPKYLARMADESRRYLFHAMTGRRAGFSCAFIRQKPRPAPGSSCAICTAPAAAHPHHSHGQRRGIRGSPVRPAQAGRHGHKFDTLCATLEIEHRLT